MNLIPSSACPSSSSPISSERHSGGTSVLRSVDAPPGVMVGSAVVITIGRHGSVPRGVGGAWPKEWLCSLVPVKQQLETLMVGRRHDEIEVLVSLLSEDRDY